MRSFALRFSVFAAAAADTRRRLRPPLPSSPPSSSPPSSSPPPPSSASSSARSSPSSSPLCATQRTTSPVWQPHRRALITPHIDSDRSIAFVSNDDDDDDDDQRRTCRRLQATADRARLAPALRRHRIHTTAAATATTRRHHRRTATAVEAKVSEHRPLPRGQRIDRDRQPTRARRTSWAGERQSRGDEQISHKHPPKDGDVRKHRPHWQLCGE